MAWKIQMELSCRGAQTNSWRGEKENSCLAKRQLAVRGKKQPHIILLNSHIDLLYSNMIFELIFYPQRYVHSNLNLFRCVVLLYWPGVDVLLWFAIKIDGHHSEMILAISPNQDIFNQLNVVEFVSIIQFVPKRGNKVWVKAGKFDLLNVFNYFLQIFIYIKEYQCENSNQIYWFVCKKNQ